MRGSIPYSRAGRTRLRHADAPKRLPMGANTPGVDATIDGGKRIGANADGLFSPVWMMNSHGTCWGRAGTIPARIVNIEARVGRILQLNKRKIRIISGRAKNRAALALSQRTPSMLTTDGRLVIPINNHTGDVVCAKTAVVRR